MRYLLDTHTYFWWRSDPGRLPQNVQTILAEMDNEPLLSVVIPWELAIKTRTGKLDAENLLHNFEQRETSAGFVMLAPTPAQAIRSGMFPFHHRDPFDRLLAAQALDLGVPLLSQDSMFDRYGVKRLWD